MVAIEKPFDLMTTASATAVATGQTLTFQYLPNRSASSFWGQGPALMSVRALQANFIQDYDFTVLYGPATVVVTYLGATTIPAGAVVGLQAPVSDTSIPFARQSTVSKPSGADSQYVFQATTPDRSSQPQDPAVVPDQTEGL